jgi:LPPG:FO 2-phospho-L-lactate transferase
VPLVVALAGGVGGAKLALGLQLVLASGDLAVVVNTGDDEEFHGLLVCPDHDTVLYTLAGLADRERGWGLAGETWAAAGQLERLGEPTWFQLGDRDLALHVHRTRRLRDGERLTTIALTVAARLGVATRILPMSDAPVRTRVRTADGWLAFQEWFVRLHQEPAVLEVAFDGVFDGALEVDSEGAGRAQMTPEVQAALAGADAIVICPSNPLVSIAPILAVPGIRDAIADARRRGIRVAAVSPIVGGKALRGPADRMLAALGEEVSALGVARRYIGLIDAFVIDEADAALAPAVERLGMRAVVAPSVMTDDASRAALARVVLDACLG